MSKENCIFSVLHLGKDHIPFVSVMLSLRQYVC